jgi:hypothetical protein
VTAKKNRNKHRQLRKTFLMNFFTPRIIDHSFSINAQAR